MLFDFNHPSELLTPIINPGGVGKVNPMLTSNGVFPLEEHDIQFPSVESKLNEFNLVTKDNPNENSDNNQQQYDLLASFNFPVLSEIEDIQYDEYLNQLSHAPCAIDLQPLSTSDDSTFYPIDDDDNEEDTSSWIAGECTIESSGYMEDMTVPLSPACSTTSGSSSIVGKRVTKKRTFSTTERKLRKKDQNKTAAEKYRLKKKLERNELNSRHSELKNQNQELKFEVENLKFRLEQFKQLFVDVLQIPLPSTK
ncbi:hypothetical protein I4U23_020498 [Adineta vaga]|nr:hypothetical protein I4U23_020498 [Adineta vaga]